MLNEIKRPSVFAYKNAEQITKKHATLLPVVMK